MNSFVIKKQRTGIAEVSPMQTQARFIHRS